MASIQLETGVSLEYTHHAPIVSVSNDDKPQKVAICLHPWSWLGGQMNDPVFQCLTPTLKQNGYHILRYNSRGVGRSSGRATFTGFDEAKDLEALIQWASKEIPLLSEVLLVGYSHGSLIASLQAPRFGGSQTYPLGPRSFLTLFRGSYYNSQLAGLIQNADGRVLILYGDQDEFTSVERYDAWASELEALLPEANANRLQISKIAGASHFWQGEAAERLLSTVSSWIAPT
ncbi:Alpha/Beta hydrolase protein [Coprinopsis sp. MPI-PUGE-AT-0042]|nr:Alpha/Beta hydrolase protein [Coprinopsis sp. MPI-PUGE-AT-0042]